MKKLTDLYEGVRGPGRKEPAKAGTRTTAAVVGTNPGKDGQARGILISIPIAFARALNLQPKMQVEIVLEDDGFRVTVPPEKQMTTGEPAEPEIPYPVPDDMEFDR